jgi:hypothetical protein
MRFRLIVAGLALAGIVATTAAAVGPEKTAFGTAKSGDLQVTSSAIMLPRAADLRGGWLNEAVPCTDTRTLIVTVEIFWSRGPSTRHVTLTKAATVDNCAEGGPNVGFTLSARANGLGCRNGKWRRGDYSFHTRTVEQTTGLEATAVLILTKTAPC